MNVTVMRLEPLSPEEWDREAETYNSWRVYHSSAWLEFVERTQPVIRCSYGIYSDGKRVGLLPGFVLRKGPFRIFGSPFPGWTTDYLGPLVNDLDQSELLLAIASRLRADGFHYCEMRNPVLDPGAAKMGGYRIEEGLTYVAPLHTDAQEMLRGFSKSCRKAIRQAPKNKLHVETTQDLGFIDAYYAQLCEVFTKSGRPPTYPRSRIETLWKCMMPTGRLIATQVKSGGTTIATRLDLCGKGWMHSFGSASSRAFLDLRPNELARFHAMQVGASKGSVFYDMSGRGEYKAKFGAQSVITHTLALGSWWLFSAKKAARVAYDWMAKGRYVFSRSRGEDSAEGRDDG